jgi:hypothetical protein
MEQAREFSMKTAIRNRALVGAELSTGLLERGELQFPPHLQPHKIK